MKVFNTFSKDISLKVNVIERLEFELIYKEAVVQLVSHYTPWDSSTLITMPVV